MSHKLGSVGTCHLYNTDLLTDLLLFSSFLLLFQNVVQVTVEALLLKKKKNLKMISMKSDAEIMLNSFKQQLVQDFIILLLKLMKKTSSGFSTQTRD